MPATIPGIPLHAHKIRKTNPMRDLNLAPIQSQVVFFFLRGHGTLIYLISEFSLAIFSLSLAAYLPSYNIFEDPMQLSVRDHDAFSNDKTLKETQIWHAKFVLLIIINMFNVNAKCRDTMIGIMTFVENQ